MHKYVFLSHSYDVGWRQLGYERTRHEVMTKAGTKLTGNRYAQAATTARLASLDNCKWTDMQ